MSSSNGFGTVAMAHGIVGAVNDSENPNLEADTLAFLAANPLPPKGLKVSTTTRLRDKNASLVDLLNPVIQSNAKELVIVVHGHLTGSGIDMTMIPRGSTAVTGDNLQALMDFEHTTERRKKDSLLGRLRFYEDDARLLLNLMNKVRAMKLTTVEWRSCDLGKQMPVLMRFQLFFGASLMGAPTMENNFGQIPFNIRPFNTIPARITQNWTPFYYPSETAAEVISYIHIDPSTQWATESAIFAESLGNLQKWVRSYINPNGTVSGSKIAMHSLWFIPELDPNNPLARRDPKPILPLEPDYQKYIRYARGPVLIQQVFR